ncbi:hypothetical protein KY290_025218 [Solanum tuberosum]|uniref:Uncharacterized protein n=1 Tax=Solanum tuberosum TaxID=4113 RepID=A0ABQ7UU47_SOLTU|nr:hypothetical protein KY284_024023 [Solanum tuberosum]KAH0754948.1 hypothetical protein KY290_025218 [Solanum tuberosum]
MAFDFSVKYKKVTKNKVVDALSRRPNVELLASLLIPNNALFLQIKKTWVSDPYLKEIISKMIAKLQVKPFKSYTWCSEQLRWEGKLVVGNDLAFRRTILEL